MAVYDCPNCEEPLVASNATLFCPLACGFERPLDLSDPTDSDRLDEASERYWLRVWSDR